jgi:hypothetical protein
VKRKGQTTYNYNKQDEYESPFEKMWDDPKFQHAINKVWQQWQVEHD